MVVIEPVATGEDSTNEKIPVVKPVKDRTSSSTATNMEDDSLRGGDAGYTSDGFETASETEFNDEDGRKEGERDLKVDTEASSKDKEDQQSHEQSLELEENKEEKALAEANLVKNEGNALFKAGCYEEALSKYETALQVVTNVSASAEICSVCHANLAACFYKLEKFEETIKECTKALELNPKYIKVLHRRGEAHEKLEHFEEAISDMTKVLELDPSNDQARRNIVRLKPLADEKREKMKEEMIGKLA